MKNITVYEVCFDLASDGRMGDGIEIYRTRNKREAESFTLGRTCYGKPATVETVDVPAAIARRWGLA